MLVGVIKIDIFIPESLSLKMKRSVVKSLKQKIRNKFNVSIAEVDMLDKWQRASLGISMVTNETKIINSVNSEIIRFIENDGTNGGIFAAGCASDALDVNRAVQSATACALKAIQVVNRVSAAEA